jgi:hypothetical protein
MASRQRAIWQTLIGIGIQMEYGPERSRPRPSRVFLFSSIQVVPV